MHVGSGSKPGFVDSNVFVYVLLKDPVPYLCFGVYLHLFTPLSS